MININNNLIIAHRDKVYKTKNYYLNISNTTILIITL